MGFVMFTGLLLALMGSALYLIQKGEKHIGVTLAVASMFWLVGGLLAF